MELKHIDIANLAVRSYMRCTGAADRSTPVLS